MFLLRSTRFILLACLVSAVGADVGGASGTPYGFAADVTGGGNATPVTPKTTAELIKYLSDSQPRVIMIDREFNFLGTEGVCTNCAGCIPTSNTCGSSGQNAIAISGSSWCNGLPSVKVTYDKAGVVGMTVASDKSLIGVGSSAVIRGKGLRLIGGIKNVIIQNIHFTELNPSLIWGGDAITLQGSDIVWIDHCKFSLIGRQMIVTGFQTAGHVSITMNEFDGKTSWSSSCDGRHYWTILGYGVGDMVTLYGNYIHDTSGRSPKLEGYSVWHAVNNYWDSNSGHAFDVSTNANALVEGNVMNNVKLPVMPETESLSGQLYVPTSNNYAQCDAALGRTCEPNQLSSSGNLASFSSDFLDNFGKYFHVGAQKASVIQDFVLKNAGVGKLSNSAVARGLPKRFGRRRRRRFS